MFALQMNVPAFFSDPLNYIFPAFCLIAAIQLFYYLYFFRKLAFYKNKSSERSQTYPVSVIICAKDEAKNLINFLPGVLVQNYPTTHEVIVVNDNSTDETKYVLEEYYRSFKQLKIVELKQEARFIPGKKYPLSVGIKTAKYEIVLLTDADCVPASEFWIDKMQQQFVEGIDIVVGYSPFRKKKGLLNKLVRWEGFHTALQYFSYAEKGLPYMGVGRNLSYKKTIFFNQKGFSSFNHLPGGDDDLFINKVSNARNTATCLDPDTFTITNAPATWSQWRRQKARHYTTSRYYKKVHKRLLGLYALSLFLFYPLMAASFFFFDWKYVLGVFALRLLIQTIIIYKAAKRLQESDLVGWLLFFDIWMFFYYLIFARSLFKKPARTWK
ncbi:MAG TPA: glycosyltransferase [Ginsengibacter sp.]|nr:glycosyltransferase [Ginsengibacter sp.]HRP17682.1 glycosyltransferase [Ginsengibacter sp.]HRP44723.1 glycosyltransferase [Ginsengibacter sp.]